MLLLGYLGINLDDSRTKYNDICHNIEYTQYITKYLCYQLRKQELTKPLTILTTAIGQFGRLILSQRSRWSWAALKNMRKSRGQNINFFFLDLPSPRWQDSNCLTPSPSTTSHVPIFLSRVAMPKLSVMYSDLLMKGMDFLEASLAWFGCFQVAHGTTEFPSAAKNLWKALPSMKLRGCGFFTGALYWVFHHLKKHDFGRLLIKLNFAYLECGWCLWSR